MEPIRMCGACREHKEKSALIKVVKASDGTIRVDERGKINGRSVYICKNLDCINKAQKTNLIMRALGCKDQSIYGEILSVFNNSKN